MFGGVPFNQSPFNGEGDIPDPPITGEGQLIAIEQEVINTPTPIPRAGFGFNMRQFNVDPFNGGTLETLTGEGQLIAIEQEVTEAVSGQLIGIEQRVGLFSGGAEVLIPIEQAIVHRAVGEGVLIEIEQVVNATGVGALIEIEQRVQSPAEIEGLIRRGWEAFVYLDGMEIECLHAQIRVTRTEGGASLMDITKIPPLGIQDIDSLAGKPITCDIQTSDGIFRIFSGKVDVPSIDLIEKKITLNCTDNRVEQINSTLGAAVSTIGYWSNVIFGEPKDIAEQLEQRLQTIPYSVDFDPYGNWSLTAKAAKATPDFILTGVPPDGVYYRDPRVDYTSRANITNKININFQYRFARLYHMQKRFTWRSPIADNLCLFLKQGYTFAQRSMIVQAIKTAGWPLRGEITWLPVQQGGWYRCQSGASGIEGPSSLIAFTTVHLTQASNVVMDTNQAGGGETPRLDAAGNPVLEWRITGGVDYGPTLANGAHWDGTTRWAQTIVENYSLAVTAPQSVAQYGTIEAANQYSSEDTTDVSSWEKYEVYDNPFNKVENSYYIDSATSRAGLNNAVVVAVNIAKTTILNLHRDTRVSVSRFIWPQVDLKHTVEINATITNGGALQARGKVFSIVHDLDCNTGEGVTNVTLALSRAQGSASDSTISIPAVGADTVDFGPTEIILGNHYGEDPEGHPEWHGRIGNAIVPAPFGFLAARTTYTEQFRVDTTRIPDALRTDRNKFGSATYNVSIPNDLLVITF